MSETSNALLQRAYTLIEDDELEKAQELLAPLLEEDANNVHLWWVYTHAVRDTGIGQAALERVLELDPQYPGARELKADVLEAQSRDLDLIALETSESGAVQSAADYDLDDWEDLQPAADPNADSSSSRARVALLVVLLIIVAGGGLVLSGAVDLPQLLTGILPSPEPQVIVVSEPTPEPTAANSESEATDRPTVAVTVAESLAEADQTPTGESEPAATAAPTLQDETATTTAEPTLAATAEPEPLPTLNTDSIRVTNFVNLVADAIEDFAIDRATSGTLPTTLGTTLIIQVCAIPGPESNERLNTVLTAIVSLAEDLPEDIEAVAAGLLNCDNPSASLRVIGVARSVLIEFANEEIKAKDFQRAWQPLS